MQQYRDFHETLYFPLSIHSQHSQCPWADTVRRRWWIRWSYSTYLFNQIKINLDKTFFSWVMANTSQCRGHSPIDHLEMCFFFLLFHLGLLIILFLFILLLPHFISNSMLSKICGPSTENIGSNAFCCVVLRMKKKHWKKRHRWTRSAKRFR